MLFKFSTVLAVAATLASAAVVQVEKRDPAQAASCTFVFTPSGTPEPGALLFSEFNYILGRNLADVDGASGSTWNGNSTVTGPSETGDYTVEQTLAADGLTTEEVIAAVTGWVGRTFAGPWSLVNWETDSVTCA